MTINNRVYLIGSLSTQKQLFIPILFKKTDRTIRFEKTGNSMLISRYSLAYLASVFEPTIV